MACVCHEEVSIICHDSQKVDRQDRNFYLKRHRTAWLQWKETLLALCERDRPRRKILLLTTRNKSLIVSTKMRLYW